MYHDMNDALAQIAALSRRFEAHFKAGNMDAAAADFYTPDARYLTGQLVLLTGRAAIADLFRTLYARIAEVYVRPVHSFGAADDNGVVYQFCNTIQHFVDGGRGYGHYTASFRRYDGTWLCEMEAPAMGWIGGGEPKS